MAVARLSGVMLLAVLATAFAMACAAASAPPTSPTQAIPPTAPRPILLDGMWNGRGSDSKGDTTVIWHLSQNGSSATLTGSASEVAGNSITASYSGSDTCEGPFVNGMMTMTRGAAATSPRPARRD